MRDSPALPRSLPRAAPGERTAKQTMSLVLLVGPATVILIVFFLVPLAYMLGYSFSHYDPIRLVVPTFTWENYAKFLTDEYVQSIVLRTLRISVLTTFFTLIIGYPVAYYMTQARGLEKTLLVMLVLWPLMTSVIVLAYGWMVLIAPNSGYLSVVLQSLGLSRGPLPLMSTEWGIVLGLTHHGLAYLILSLHASLEGIDPSYLRAAAILGATPAQTFRKVTLPLSLPGMLSGCLLVFAIASSAFMIPLLFSGRQIPVLTVYAYELNATQLNWPMGAATGIVLLILSGISIFLFSSYVSRLRGRLAQ